MRRHRVRLRPKDRRRRRSGFTAGLALALAASAVAFVPWRQLAARAMAVSSARFSWPRAAAVASISITGAPEAVRSELLAAVSWRPGDRWGPMRAEREARKLRENFPCLKTVRARRSWGDHAVAFEVALRRPLSRARATGAEGRAAWTGYIDETGVLFAMPRMADNASPESRQHGVAAATPGGLYGSEALPEIDLGAYPREKPLESLAKLIAAAARSEGPGGGLRRLRYEEGDGWRAELADGTHLLWGDLRWTEQKLGRLGEVLTDAGARFGGAAVADLRHFDEGKIFVRPR